MTRSLDALNRYGFIILFGLLMTGAPVEADVSGDDHRAILDAASDGSWARRVSDEPESAARLQGRAARVRGAARSAAPPGQEARARHPRHPDRVHHRSLPADARPHALAQPRRRRRVPAHGGDAGAPEVARAGAARPRRGGGARRRGRRGWPRSAAGADPAPARVPEVQGRGRQARRAAGHRAQRLAARRQRRGRGRAARAAGRRAAGRGAGLPADRVARARACRAPR